MVPGNTNGRYHIFVSDRQDRTVDSISFVASAHPISLESVTAADNSGNRSVDGKVTAYNSLFVRNSPRSIFVNSTGFNIFQSIGLISIHASDRVIANADSGVGPLQDNGGPTWTHALLPGAAAIDTADPANYLASDQRGIPRPQDGDGIQGPRTDVGAFEAFEATLRATVFLDRNGNGVRDPGESALSEQFVYVDGEKNGRYDEGELSASTDAVAQQPSGQQDAAASFNLDPATHWVNATTRPGWSRTNAAPIERVNVANDDAQDNSGADYPSISADGRFIAFESSGSNLVPGDTNLSHDVFALYRPSIST